MIDGEPMLCLAACAAEAGLLERGLEQEAQAFRGQAARASDKGVLYEAFDRLGWRREACEIKLAFNDSQSPALRRQRILEALAAT